MLLKISMGWIRLNRARGTPGMHLRFSLSIQSVVSPLSWNEVPEESQRLGQWSTDQIKDQQRFGMGRCWTPQVPYETFFLRIILELLQASTKRGKQKNVLANGCDLNPWPFLSEVLRNGATWSSWAWSRNDGIVHKIWIYLPRCCWNWSITI